MFLQLRVRNSHFRTRRYSPGKDGCPILASITEALIAYLGERKQSLGKET
jgi:hypothetical protein